MRVAIIGAGMAGILAAIKLDERGLDDVVVYEKADALGGTWRENTYPGVGCDVPSHLYSYSFEPNPGWSRRFSPGEEIHRYLQDVADRHGVTPKVCFGVEIASIVWTDGQWHLESTDGQRDVADVVIAATGVLHHPRLPDIPGLDDFAGPMFHTAHWDHGVDLDGRRVGMIGTGSSAVQVTPAIVDRVARLTLFQRTPQWIAAIENPLYTVEEQARFRDEPAVLDAIRSEMETVFNDGFAAAVIDAGSAHIMAIEESCRMNLETSVTDPVLREKLRPDYRAACKRLVVSANFYEAVQKPQVDLVVERIDRIESNGVRTVDGVLHELDVLVLATGFRTDRFLRPIRVVGDGADLDDVWSSRPSAYLSVSIPQFPNLFLLNGPNGPVGNFSLIQVAELQMDYILGLLDEIAAGRCRALSASESAATAFEEQRTQAAKRTVWATGCNSWYLDDRGVPAAWPFTFQRFREEMAAPRLDHFDLVG